MSAHTCSQACELQPKNGVRSGRASTTDHASGMLRFTLFGVPVRIEPWFWLIGLLFGGSRLDLGRNIGVLLLVSWLFVWLVSFLIHEFGHAFFQRKFGGHPEILLYGCGGLAIGNGYFSRWQSLIISAAGPVVEIGAGLLAWWLLETVRPQGFFLRAVLSDFSWICIVWGLFNLVPMLPLDGGRILNALTNGNTRLVAAVGTLAGLLTVAYFLLSGFLLIAVYVGYFCWRNFETWRRGYRSDSFMGEI
jgi:stage IV sporulation protein FB